MAMLLIVIVLVVVGEFWLLKETGMLCRYGIHAWSSEELLATHKGQRYQARYCTCCGAVRLRTGEILDLPLRIS